MSKTISLKQLAEKTFVLVPNLPEKLCATVGRIEDCFDAIVYGESGNGKSSFLAELLTGLLPALKAKCEYIAFEEGHGLTIQENFVGRRDLVATLGQYLKITDHLTYEELDKKMANSRSAKVWVIDSLQASNFTADQCAKLKKKYVLSRRRKIIIYISWAKGKKPESKAGISVEYYANIKMRVEGFVVFPKSRYGGNKPFVIYEQGAMDHWGNKYYTVTKIPKPKKAKKGVTDEAL